MSTAPGEVVPWERRRLLAIVGVAIATAAVLLAGLGLAVYFAVKPLWASQTRAGQVSRTGPATLTGQAHRDAVAAAPMLAVDDTAAAPTVPAAVAAPTITIPSSRTQGPAGVTSGFPHSPEGAIGQLAAIEQTVLQGMSIQQVNAVHDAWAMPGAPAVAQWPLAQNVQAFLGSAQMAGALDPTSTVVVTPSAAQVKGTDGPDWVLACVLVRVRATIATDAQMGYGYCERMQWHETRWMIAPDSAPAPAPSTWPGSELAGRAGWRTWAGGQG